MIRRAASAPDIPDIEGSSAKRRKTRLTRKEAQSEIAIVPANKRSAVVMGEKMPERFIFEYYECIYVSFGFYE
jgi:hypothetical protein